MALATRWVLKGNNRPASESMTVYGSVSSPRVGSPGTGTALSPGVQKVALGVTHYRHHGARQPGCDMWPWTSG